MRVFLTVNFSPWSRYRGGGQRSTHFLACALSARGHDVSVIFTKPPWERVATPELPYRPVWAAMPSLRSRSDAPLRPLSALSVALAVRRLARAHPPDVVHSQGEEGAFLSEAVDCPLVLTPRYGHYPARVARVLNRRAPAHEHVQTWLLDAKYLILARAARRAAWVCPTSRASALAAQGTLGVCPTRLRVVPNGIDPSFGACQRDADASKGPLVYFGKVENDKGIETLIDAFAQTLHHRRKLVVVGEGPRLPWLRAAVRSRGLSDWVELEPWQPSASLAARLSGAALAVLPSMYESFGNAMLEAMAACVPLVASDVGVLSETARDGTSCTLVPPGDSTALASAINGLLASPAQAEAMGQAGQAHVRANYAWDAVAAQYESLYREAHGARTHARSSNRG